MSINHENHKLTKPEGHFHAHCVHCHHTDALCLVPHRDEEDRLVGFIFACSGCFPHLVGATVTIDDTCMEKDDDGTTNLV